jgi:hypothetical protein
MCVSGAAFKRAPVGVFSLEADSIVKQYIVPAIVALLTSGSAAPYYRPNISGRIKPQLYVRNLYIYANYLVNNGHINEDAALKELGNVINISSQMQIRGNNYRMVASQPEGFIFSKMMVVDKIIFLGDKNGVIYNVDFYVKLRPCLPKNAIFKTFGRFPKKDKLTDFPNFASYSKPEKWGYYIVNVQRTGPPCVMMFMIKFDASRAPQKGSE